MKAYLQLLVATLLVLAGTAFAQTNTAPPTPAAPPAPKALTQEQIQELLRKRREELRKLAGTNAAPTAVTNAPPRRMTPLPTTPTTKAAPALPAPQPARPAVQAPALPSLPAPGVPAGQVKPAVAATVKPGKGTVLPPGFINFKNMDLFQALDFYAELVGRTVLRPTSLPATQISLKSQTELTREEAIQALDSVFALNGITTVPIGEKFVSVVPSAQAIQEGAAFTSKDAGQLAEAAQFTTQIIQLKHVLPSEVQQAITPFAKNPSGIVAIDGSRTLVLRDYAINVKRMMEVIEKIDVDVPLEVELELIPIKYALVTDIAAVLGSLTSGGAAATPTSSSSSRRTGASSSRGRSGSRGGLGVSTGLGTQTGQPGQPGYNPLQRSTTQPASASGAVSSFQDRLRSIVSRAASGGDTPLLGDAKIIPDERTNSLLVFATKQERQMIKDIVAKLDVVQAQVLIEAIIMDVSLNDSLDYGVSMSQNRHSANGYSGAAGSVNGKAPLGFLNPNSVNTISNFPSGFSYFGTLKDNFNVVLTAAASDGRVNVLSRPRIQTSHAVEAEIFSGETRPVPSGTYYGLSSTPSTQIQQQQIGIRLTVLPLINQDGLVVMDISQTVQDVTGTTPIEGTEYPIIGDREASSRVAVKDGDTIILGGFIRTKKTTNKSGVPLLRDIPLLGKLFSSKSDATERSELIVLIRPTVLATPDIAALTAQREHDKMIGVKAAEAELSNAQRKQDQVFSKDIKNQIKDGTTSEPLFPPASKAPLTEAQKQWLRENVQGEGGQTPKP